VLRRLPAPLLLLGLAMLTHPAAAQTARFLLGPPPQDGPVVVSARFALRDINAIDDSEETFEFSGVSTLQWRDPRQAFDPAEAGVAEKIFQGSFQFNEISPGWFPQLVLVNESTLYQTTGVLLRVLPDGTSTLLQTITAIAEGAFDMRRFPYDHQRLEAVFEILGVDRDEVALQVSADAAQIPTAAVHLPQWRIKGATLAVVDRRAAYAGHSGIASSLVVSVAVQRLSWFEQRLIVLPLIVVVLLSFSVFWMDRSSLGDRLNISFIGILSAVAYQIVTSDQLPRISYHTLMHTFLGVSFLTMCATVVINLRVGALDKRGEVARGDRVDQLCRWLFPIGYFGFLLGMVAVEHFEP